jgi:hypothetical protein
MLRLIVYVGHVPNNELQVQKYAELVRSHYTFHHTFWSRNNVRFSQAQQSFEEANPQGDWAGFYREYMLKHRDEFAVYHRESWRRAFKMLFEEYRFNLWTLSLHLHQLSLPWARGV